MVQQQLSAGLNPKEKHILKPTQLPAKHSSQDHRVTASISLPLSSQQAEAGAPHGVAEGSGESEHRAFEAPGAFSERQLNLMQQRQQQLLQHRLAALPGSLNDPAQPGKHVQPQPAPAGVSSSDTQGTSPKQPCSSDRDSKGSQLDISEGHKTRTVAKGPQSSKGRDSAADSPITLFSLGSPYSTSSLWSSLAGSETTCNADLGMSQHPPWGKLKGASTLLGTGLVKRGSKIPLLRHESSAFGGKLSLKGNLSRASSGLPLPAATEGRKQAGAVSKAGTSRKRTAFAKGPVEREQPDERALHASSDQDSRAGKTSPSSKASLQDEGSVLPSTAGSAAAVGQADAADFVQQVTSALQEEECQPRQEQPPPKEGMQTGSAAGSSLPDLTSAFDDLQQAQSTLPGDDKSPGITVKKQEIHTLMVSPRASPLARVVTYRPDELRSAASAYQASDAAANLGKTSVRDSMWEDSPVLGTGRNAGKSTEQQETQKQFDAQLGQWYKEQLQRRMQGCGQTLRSLTSVRISD